MNPSTSTSQPTASTEAAFAPATTDADRSEVARLSAIMSKETIGGGLLIAAAALGIVLANSPLAEWYFGLRDSYAGVRVGEWSFEMSIGHWAADGFLAVFFFLAGLELKREFVAGDLRKPSRAAIPIVAAFGGVAVPALIFVAINWSSPDTLHGWAIPTATDIAFAIAVLAVVGSKLPLALRTFLLTLAVVDDLIAISIIAIFYTSALQLWYLIAAMVPLALYWIVAHRRRDLFRRDLGAAWYMLLPLGLACWMLFYLSGVHATIAGVLLGFAVPVRPRGKEDPSLPSLAETFEHRFRPLSAGICVPIFAFFSAGVSFSGLGGDGDGLLAPVSLGIMLALLLGKPLGITLAVWLTTRVRGINLDASIRWLDVFALATLAGIGFTVSLLIAELSFPVGDPSHELAKIAIFIASGIAAIVGGGMLWFRGRSHARADTNTEG